MSAPESTPALEALLLRLADLNKDFQEHFAVVQGVSALPSASAKLPAPAGLSYTRPVHWRKHLVDLWRQLADYFGDKEFRANELRIFLKDRVDLLPEDKEISSKGEPRWFNRLHGAINARTSRWGQTPPIYRVGDHDLWRVSPMPDSTP